ncbi:hypothetical protein Bbelb_265640 [Branchiostoma belcheri]|nr:hypothetical protein Bbelb_265640 [Branchiostoma belcheri]
MPRRPRDAFAAEGLCRGEMVSSNASRLLRRRNRLSSAKSLGGKTVPPRHNSRRSPKKTCQRTVGTNTIRSATANTIKLAKPKTNAECLRTGTLHKIGQLFNGYCNGPRYRGLHTADVHSGLTLAE